MRSLNKARAQQRDFQAKRNEVRRYFNAVIIPDVLALNLQVRDPFPNKQFK
jgi:hypothetical protein